MKSNLTSCFTPSLSLSYTRNDHSFPHVKKLLWSGKFWTESYFTSTVGCYLNESTIRDYIKKQGIEYQ
ncbi:transposase [Nitrosomonas communis]|uniref:transposase n=1 Tax=Nitrosomonas communis TaxID=44574 RepID=UPI0009F5DFA1